MGGIDACIDFDDPDNKGLRSCLTKIDIQSNYRRWCDKVSLADFMTFATEASLARLSDSWDSKRPFHRTRASDPLRKKIVRDGKGKIYPMNHINPIGGKFAIKVFYGRRTAK